MDRRWTPEDVVEAEELIRVGMAYAIWEDGVATALEESRQPDGDAGMTEVLQDIDRTEPEDAAYTAADDLRKLYAAANGTAEPGEFSKDAELALEVAQDAIEQTQREEDVEIALARIPAPMFLLALKASAAMGLKPDELMADTDLHDFGYYAYMEAVGHGVSWEDSHKAFDHWTPDFDSHLIGTTLSWYGSSTPRRYGKSRVRGEDAAPGWRMVKVNGDQKTSIEYDEPEETRVIRRVEVEMEDGAEGEGDRQTGIVDDDEVMLEDPDADSDETWTTIAIRYLREQGATEPSSSEYYPRVWYSAEAQQNFRTGAWTEVTCHLGESFTDEERREIFNVMSRRI